MSARARQAIAEADTVIGYVTYVRLVAPLLEGKEVIRKSMTEELDRAVEALERARQGKTVALISSGDAGVYGMAGPTFEVLFAAGWQPEATWRWRSSRALGHQRLRRPGGCAAHARFLCHFALRPAYPWPVIARRLEAAAAADFVVALYNPKSGRRTRHIVEAQRLLLRHRAPDTPVPSSNPPTGRNSASN